MLFCYLSYALYKFMGGIFMNEKNLSVDEWIKRLEEEFEKNGLPKPKYGNKTGHSIIIMPKNSKFVKNLRANEIRKYNKYEKYIIENNNLTYKELDFLLKGFANANVRETNERNFIKNNKPAYPKSIPIKNIEKEEPKTESKEKPKDNT